MTRPKPSAHAHPYADYYVWHMNDDTWRISARTEHQWNGYPDMPWAEQDKIFDREADARAHLAQMVVDAKGGKHG